MAEIFCKCHIAPFECIPSQTDGAKLPRRALAALEAKSYLCGLAIREINFGTPSCRNDIKDCLSTNNPTL